MRFFGLKTDRNCRRYIKRQSELCKDKLRPQEYQLRHEGGGRVCRRFFKRWKFFGFALKVRAKSSNTLRLERKAVNAEGLAHAVTSRARGTADVQLSKGSSNRAITSPSCSLNTLPL